MVRSTLEYTPFQGIIMLSKAMPSMAISDFWPAMVRLCTRPTSGKNKFNVLFLFKLFLSALFSSTLFSSTLLLSASLLSALLLSSAVFAEVIARELPYKAPDGTQLMAYYAYDDSQPEKKRPGILVVHEWWGQNDYARQRARELAALGYAALALDMYGEGKSTDDAKQAALWMHGVMNDPIKSLNRAQLGLGLLVAQPEVDSAKLGAVGYCFGGKVVLDMARSGMPLQGVVSVHGNLTPTIPAQPDTVKARILVLHGGADSMVSYADVGAFRKEMAAAKVPYKLIVYPNAKHAFSNPDADRLAEENHIDIGYNAAADRRSWAHLRTFFSRIFEE